MKREELWLYVHKGGPDDCWEWQRSRQESGHGRVYIHGDAMRPAHRIAYELVKGPILEGLVIDHLCRNPPCCNPAHLEAVTHRENVKRGAVNAGRYQRSKTHCKHGHPFDEENTLVVPDGSRQCRECNRLRQRRERAEKKARLQEAST